MQIRFANRQDEAQARALLEKDGGSLDLLGADKDMHNLDGGYFGQEGLFIVAEEEGEIIALAGARRLAEDPNILELTRMAGQLEKVGTADGAGTDPATVKDRFLSIIQNHAYQMDFKTIKVRPNLESLIPSS